MTPRRPQVTYKRSGTNPPAADHLVRQMRTSSPAGSSGPVLDPRSDRLTSLNPNCWFVQWFVRRAAFTIRTVRDKTNQIEYRLDLL